MSKGKRQPRGKIRAFGESKTLYGWSQDVRCKACYRSLRDKIAKGWDAEKAITTRRRAKKIKAFGRFKTVADWARDERCRVSNERLRRRLEAGWPAEIAMTAPLGHIHAKPTRKGRRISAFGEVKNISQWARDSRCRVCVNTLRTRFRQGWDAELAISTPVRTLYGATRPNPGRFYGPRN